MALDRNFSIAAPFREERDRPGAQGWHAAAADPTDTDPTGAEPTGAEPLSQNAFREFANWRLRAISDRPRESIRFFRGSLNHTAVWMLVMRGHYDGDPPTVGTCQDICTCSRLTARKLISHAVSLGYLELRSDPVDHRKRTVSPTDLTVREYVGMVRRYLSMCEVLRPGCQVLAPEFKLDA